MDAPFVSIIVPTLNRPDFLRQTLSCIQQQTYRAFEVIVVDQSTPARPTQCADIPDFRYFHLPKQNLPAARNLGISNTRGSIVLFLDDDVSFGPLLAAAHVRAHAANPGAGAVTGRIRLNPPHFYPPQKTYALLDPKSGKYSANCDLDAAGFVTCMSGCNMSLKKKALDAVGPFDANYRGNALYEEIDFSLRLTRKGFHIWFEPAASLTHFRADNGGCRASAGTAYLRAKFRNTGYFFSKNLSLLPGPAFFIALKNEIEFYTREKEGGHRLGEALLHFFSACRGLARGALKRLSGL